MIQQIALSVISKTRLGESYRVPQLKFFNKSTTDIMGGEGNNAFIKDRTYRPPKTYLVGESVEQVTFLLNYPEIPVSQYASIQSAAAAGTTQGGATAITSFICVVTSADAANTGVVLPKANEDQVDYTYLVCNRTGLTINTYPSSGDSLNDLAVDLPVTIEPGTLKSFYVRAPLDDL